MLTDLVRRLGILAKRVAPPGTAGYAIMRRTAWLLPASLRADYRADPISERLHRFARRRAGDVFFVQVGSHDGGAGDPLSLYIERDGWRGLLVEPDPAAFARLERRHGGRSGSILENVAVAETDGPRAFYRLRPEAREVYERADQLGSLRRGVVVSHAHRIPELEDHLEVIEVPCFSFATLFERHGIERVDLLHLDAEGYDGILLHTFPWSRFIPQLVLYEHKHLEDAARADSEELLRAQGYELTTTGSNTLAERREV